jgi:hypothetical protein
MIEGEQGRATTEAKGAQGGSTVGGRLRGTLKSLRDHFGCPIQLDGPLVEGAAPASGSPPENHNTPKGGVYFVLYVFVLYFVLYLYFLAPATVDHCG